MKYRINYEILDENGDYHPDSVILDGDSVDEIREKADLHLANRGGKNPWSEEIK